MYCLPLDLQLQALFKTLTNFFYLFFLVLRIEVTGSRIVGNHVIIATTIHSVINKGKFSFDKICHRFFHFLVKLNENNICFLSLQKSVQNCNIFNFLFALNLSSDFLQDSNFYNLCENHNQIHYPFHCPC